MTPRIATFQRHCLCRGPAALKNIRLDHTGKITVLIEELTSEGGVSVSAGAGLYWFFDRPRVQPAALRASFFPSSVHG